MKVVSTKLDEKTLRVLKLLARDRRWTISQVVRHYLQRLARATSDAQEKVLK